MIDNSSEHFDLELIIYFAKGVNNDHISKYRGLIYIKTNSKFSYWQKLAILSTSFSGKYQAI